MSRCAICNHLEGYSSSSDPFVLRHSARVKWRDEFSEFQCDDCYSSVNNTTLEMMLDDLDIPFVTLDDSPRDADPTKIKSSEDTSPVSDL